MDFDAADYVVDDEFDISKFRDPEETRNLVAEQDLEYELSLIADQMKEQEKIDKACEEERLELEIAAVIEKIEKLRKDGEEYVIKFQGSSINATKKFWGKNTLNDIHDFVFTEVRTRKFTINTVVNPMELDCSNEKLENVLGSKRSKLMINLT
jgi:hypothetical protein